MEGREGAAGPLVLTHPEQQLEQEGGAGGRRGASGGPAFLQACTVGAWVTAM